SRDLFEAGLSAELGIDQSRGQGRRLGPRGRSRRAELGTCGAAQAVGSWRTMSEAPEARARRRWINLGELIALAALIVSAFGVWIAWRSSTGDKPTRVVEQHQPVPLTLRGMPNSNGSEISISPVDPGHA